MLIIPNSNVDTVNIIGIDPGTTFLGVAILTISIYNLEITSSEAFTLDANSLHCNTWLNEIHGDRFSRINSLEKELDKVFDYYKPLVICSESPFFGMRHPGAFQALIEIICSIRNSVYNYDKWKQLELVPPSNVKQSVGAKGNSTKDEMKSKVYELINVLKYDEHKFKDLDEHSIDALAVGYYSYLQLF